MNKKHRPAFLTGRAGVSKPLGLPVASLREASAHAFRITPGPEPSKVETHSERRWCPAALE